MYITNIHIFILIMFDISFNKRELEKKIFPVIMRKNIIKSHSLYNEIYSQKLLKKLKRKLKSNLIKMMKNNFLNLQKILIMTLK